ncbi:phage tail protein [Sphingomonas sp. MMS12-HWE2-04]|uniref:phage tail protein n=1 Tax=Sphingomonas sp. MMS12-HWE2-04 TaxID=3234199 RepID=UPI00384E468E
MDTLALLHLIAPGEPYPGHGGDGGAGNVMGLIHHFAGRQPIFHAYHAGARVPIEQNNGLYAVLGIGNEQDRQFAVPDLRGKMLVDAAFGAETPPGSFPVRHIIAARPERHSRGFPMPGVVMPFAGRFVPDGWLAADGRLLDADRYRELFAAIGTQFGGDGVRAFALPDLRGAVPVGAGEGLAPGTRIEGEVPGVALHYILSASGIFGTEDGYGFPEEEPVYGEVVAWAGSETPKDWLACDGAVLPIARQHILFHILGDAYGGDGETSFALPDLRGRAIVGR